MPRDIVCPLYQMKLEVYIMIMAIRTILKMGNPTLLEKAETIESHHVDQLTTLVPDMIETMRAAGGVGLAAPQIGEKLRVIIFEIPKNRTSDLAQDNPVELQILINPVFEPLGREIELDWEGCLSIPGLRGEVPRFKNITYRGLDSNGNSVTSEASGFHARVVQHEIDHLDGILYPERMVDLRKFGFADEMIANPEYKTSKNHDISKNGD